MYTEAVKHRLAELKGTSFRQVQILKLTSCRHRKDCQMTLSRKVKWRSMTMARLTIKEAVKVIPVSESKLRRDMKAGVVSFEVDEKGKKRFDPSELARVYGQIDLPENNGQVKESNPPLSETGHDRGEIIALKDNQIEDLKSQLQKAESQLQIATTEKTKLLDLLSAEKEEKRALMPPPPVDNGTPSWWDRLTGRSSG